MKKMMACLAVLVVFAAAVSTVEAKENETELAFDSVKLWDLAGLPAYFFFEDFLHESSHALVVKAFGGSVTSFKPYPHYTDDGALLMGRFMVRDKELSDREEAFVAVAPYLTDVALFVSTDLLLSFGLVEPRSVGGLILYSVGMFAPFVDFVYNSHGFGQYNDFVRFSQETGMSRYTLLVITECIAFIAAYRLVARGIEVFSKDVPAKESSVVIAPSFAGGALGLGAAWRF